MSTLINPALAGKGIAKPILQHLEVLTGNNDPSTKIRPAGTLKALIDNPLSLDMPDYEKLRLSTPGGQYRDIKLWTYARAGASDVNEAPTCDPAPTQLRKEFTLDAPCYSEVVVSIPHTLLEAYTEDAIKTVALGKEPTAAMQEFMRLIMTKIPALTANMNKQLLGKVKFGRNPYKNVAAGSAVTVNISKDGTILDLEAGVSEILNQYQLNEWYGDPMFIGAGLMNNFQKRLLSNILAPNSGGQNFANTSGYKWYLDTAAPQSAAYGNSPNRIGVFAPGTIGLIDVDQFVNFKAFNYGTVQQFQIDLPVESGVDNPATMTFDVRAKFNDCVTSQEVTDGYGVQSTLPTQGGMWTFTISKRYGLYQLDTDIFSSSDVLNNSNGAFLYDITNND